MSAIGGEPARGTPRGGRGSSGDPGTCGALDPAATWVGGGPGGREPMSMREHGPEPSPGRLPRRPGTRPASTLNGGSPAATRRCPPARESPFWAPPQRRERWSTRSKLPVRLFSAGTAHRPRCARVQVRPPEHRSTHNRPSHDLAASRQSGPTLRRRCPFPGVVPTTVGGML
jgi:hypothetical protein